MQLTIIAIGDINGKIGRRAVTAVLPRWRKKHRPDFVIANAENLAHGTGVTRKTLDEVRAAGIDFFTTGNHVYKKPEATELLTEENPTIIRPANFPHGSPGLGVRTVMVKDQPVTIINLQGQVFMEEPVNNPFHSFDQIYKTLDGNSLILVDFHAEATSEKVAFGWHVAGRAQAMWGTHTHVQTADERVLPGGTAYITDLGMVGERDSVIGVKRDIILHNFMKNADDPKQPHDIAETGPAIINAVKIILDAKSRQAVSIERLHEEVEIR